MEHKINQSMLELFRQRLIEGEKSNVTLEKYMRDVKAFWKFSETYGYVNKICDADWVRMQQYVDYRLE